VKRDEEMRRDVEREVLRGGERLEEVNRGGERLREV
jgi:hypothetical protein